MTSTVQSTRRRGVCGSTMSRGLVTVLIALAASVAAGYLFAPSSMSKGALLGMLPFAAVLAIARSARRWSSSRAASTCRSPGSISLVVVIVTHDADGNDSKLAAGAAARPRRRAGRRARSTACSSAASDSTRSSPRSARTPCSMPPCWASPAAPRGRPPTCWRTSPAGARSASPTRCSSPSAHRVTTTLAVKRTVAGRRFEAVGANPRRPGPPACASSGTAPAATSGPSSSTGWAASCSPASSPSRPPSRATPTSCPPWRRSCSAARRCSAAGATSSPR